MSTSAVALSKRTMLPSSTSVRSVTDHQGVSVALVPVDEAVLEQLVAAATSDADPDEVTPPVTTGEAWEPARIEWLRAFHRDRRSGLDGSLGETTWAVVMDAHVVGSARLKLTGEPGVLEIGMWLTRRARGHGVGRSAMFPLLQRAAASGAVRVRAETTEANVAALHVLRRVGFTLTAAETHGCVRALIVLDSSGIVAAGPGL
jgi:RimJ/RimL family protein N-acetyltransferase